MPRKPTKEKLRREYLAGGTSYAKLAKKYNISVSTVKRWAKEGSWVAGRSQTDAKVNAEMPDIIAGEKKQIITGVMAAALKLLKILQESLDRGPQIMEPKEIRAYAAAIKDLKEIAEGRSDLDVAYQQARIDKLKHDIDKSTDTREITVVMEGEAEGYAD